MAFHSDGDDGRWGTGGHAPRILVEDPAGTGFRWYGYQRIDRPAPIPHPHGGTGTVDERLLPAALLWLAGDLEGCAAVLPGLLRQVGADEQAAERLVAAMVLRDLAAVAASEPTEGQAGAHRQALPDNLRGDGPTSRNFGRSAPLASGLVATDTLEISGAEWAPVWVSRIQDVDPRPRGEVVWQAELEAGMGAEPVPEGTPGAIIAPCDWAAIETLARYGLAFNAGNLWFTDRTSRSARALVVRVNGRQIRLS